ncbi:hypothetical protein [Variovorax guangxiensis]|uniref:hypothetical protein n=1 Tax=Variovorax guangxiensis TaxID=1775474 RepID=UPI0028604F01|nr:hypothetical protein [Variovorax guangxiensis]MDR6859722.1 hypothetical protein [Variovorax guangxiensis]
MPSSRSVKPWRDRLAGHPGLPEVKYPGGLEELMRRLESEGYWWCSADGAIS